MEEYIEKEKYLEKNKQIGIHFVYNINDINKTIINDNNYLKDVFNKLMKTYKLSILNVIFHEFEPYGLTGLYLLSESHLSFHTWPEHGKICLDLFSCSKDMSYDTVIDYLKDTLQTNNIDVLKINR